MTFLLEVVPITGGSTHNMTKEDPSDTDFTDGCIYTVSTKLSRGFHDYYCEASNGTELIRFPENGNITGPYINTAPTLAGGNVTPSNGTIYTTFTYSVNYTDADNTPPAYVHAVIDGVPHNMTKLNPNEVPYENGCIYTYSTNLNVNNHNY